MDLDGDGTITNDRPAGLDTSVGRRDVDQSLQIINSFRASRGLAPIPASLLKLDPYVSLDARVTKVIPLSVNRRLDLFFEGYNLTNHENFTPYTAEPQRAASGGVVFGGLRGADARSYAYATLRSVGSLHGCPRRSMPTGSPSDVNPAGILIAGNPVVALS